jgi:hypothetical protein
MQPPARFRPPVTTAYRSSRQVTSEWQVTWQDTNSRSPGHVTTPTPAVGHVAAADQLAAGVIAICPIVELEFLSSARSLADRLEKRRLLREVFGWVAMSDRAYERADEVQQLLTETAGIAQQVPSICSLPRPPNVTASSSCATTAISRRWPQLPASQSSSSPTCSRPRSQGLYGLLTTVRHHHQSALMAGLLL